MSSLAFVGEQLGYSSGDGCCSPCGNRRQVVHTVNGLYGDIILAAGDGLSLSIVGNTFTFSNTLGLVGATVYANLQGSGGLEAISTIGVVDKLFWVIEAGIVRGWRLALGVAATDIPNGIMRPSGAEALTKNFIREI